MSFLFLSKSATMISERVRLTSTGSSVLSVEMSKDGSCFFVLTDDNKLSAYKIVNSLPVFSASISLRSGATCASISTHITGQFILVPQYITNTTSVIIIYEFNPTANTIVESSVITPQSGYSPAATNAIHAMSPSGNLAFVCMTRNSDGLRVLHTYKKNTTWSWVSEFVASANIRALCAKDETSVFVAVAGSNVFRVFNFLVSPSIASTYTKPIASSNAFGWSMHPHSNGVALSSDYTDGSLKGYVEVRENDNKIWSITGDQLPIPSYINGSVCISNDSKFLLFSAVPVSTPYADGNLFLYVRNGNSYSFVETVNKQDALSGFVSGNYNISNADIQMLKCSSDMKSVIGGTALASATRFFTI